MGLAQTGRAFVWRTAIAFALSLSAARAQTPDFANHHPAAAATRVEASQAPAIDGDLSDPVWDKAVPFDGFYQVNPDLGRPASERTEVRVLYDENAVYFFVHAYDREPDKIVANLKGRDVRMPNDDNIRIILDPTASGRNGYNFEINPNGAYTDALIQNNSTFNVNWNGIWTVAARRVADGWVAEAAIPFRSMSYNPDASAWNFNIQRTIRRKNEEVRWANVSRNYRNIEFSNVGTLTGFAGVKQGLGLEVQAFAKAGYARTFFPAPGKGDASFEPSGNLYYRITPDFTATLTANTDFSNTPLDQRQVNLTRFTLFLPETREFFLQDAALFEFGGAAFSKNTGNFNIGQDTNGQAFFTRNIGRAAGTLVPVLAGAKLSGVRDNLRLGGLTVQTKRAQGPGGAITPQNLSVARTSAGVGEGSQVGMIVTHGDPLGAGNNTLAGADYLYRTTVFGNKVFRADAFYERTFSSLKGDDDAFGFATMYPNEPLWVDLEFRQIGRNFAPALGFINRPAIRFYTGDVVRRTRFAGGSAVRYVDAAARLNLVTDLSGLLQSRNAWVWGALSTATDDLFQLQGRNHFERVNVAYNLPGAVRMPAGVYDWNEVNLHVDTSGGRLVDLHVDATCCAYYAGHDLHTDITANIKPSGTYYFTLQHTMDLIRLPTGRVNVHVVSVSGTVNFTNEMYLASQLQYDNISHNVGVSLRYAWRIDPATELFAAIGTFATAEGEVFNPFVRVLTSEFIVRLGHTWRF